MVFWAMHPWERDARLVKNALLKEPHLYNVIIEIACTRSSEELLGARKAYHSLYDHSIEEDVAVMVPGPESKVRFLILGALNVLKSTELKFRFIIRSEVSSSAQYVAL